MPNKNKVHSIKIELSYDVAQHYDFTYLWKVHHQSPDKPLCLEGGLLQDGLAMLGSIPIKVGRIKGISDTVRAII